ncbi:NAD(P)/FAD-dependent oxidoreductase [Chloroflexota bacterium]
MINKENVKYLIIGNSAGGVGAVEAIREVDKSGGITIVSDEPYPTYSRPMISDYLANGCPIDKMLFRPIDFYEKNQVQTALGRKVIELNTDKRTAKLDDESTISWKKLLLATGGSPFIPKMAGISREGFFTFTTLDDAKAIDVFLNKHPERKVRAVVIGGGLIGVSVTEALVKRGVEVTIIEMMDRILSTILDETASTLEKTSLKESGVNIITGHTVNKVNSNLIGEPISVTLDDGQTISCDMLVVAIGVRPRTELVINTELMVNRGIVVNRHMGTSSPDIYACGDVAEAYDFIYNENRLTPIWPNAYVG